jgi:hypothetical protein
MRRVYTALALALALPALAQEPTPTPCPDLTRQVVDASTGLVTIECYSDPTIITEPTAIVLDSIAAAARVQVDLDYEQLRQQYQTAKAWLDLMDQHAATLAAMPNTDLDSIAELRAVIRTMGVDFGRMAEIQRRQLRVLARIVGGVEVEPQPTPTPTP